MTNILIIAAKKNPVRRRMWEDGLAAELSAHGVVCVPSYRLFANAIPDTQQVEAVIQANKYDGILVVNKLQTETSTRYIPGSVRSVPETRYNRWAHTYYTVYQQVQDSGYVQTDKLVRNEINVWTTKEEDSERMVWTATGETMDPNSGGTVRDEITSLIVPELARQGIIPEKK